MIVLTYELKIDELCLLRLRCVGFALNGINVPVIPAKKIYRSQNIKYEIVLLSEWAFLYGITQLRRI